MNFWELKLTNVDKTYFSLLDKMSFQTIHLWQLNDCWIFSKTVTTFQHRHKLVTVPISFRSKINECWVWTMLIKHTFPIKRYNNCFQIPQNCIFLFVMNSAIYRKITFDTIQKSVVLYLTIQNEPFFTNSVLVFKLRSYPLLQRTPNNACIRLS